MVGTDKASFGTAGYWLARAEEVRARADELRDVDARLFMLEIATRYELMAVRTSLREAERKNGRGN